MHTLFRAALVALAFCCPMVEAQEAVPPPLRDWEDWVLHGEEFRRCPFLASTTLTPGHPIVQTAYRCDWPERLSLAVDARGGSFSQRWQVFAATWVGLPGNLEHWPRDVRLNGAAAPVVEMGGVPSLRLTPGNYAISGRFEWASRPEALPIPDNTAIVELTVDGQRVGQPERPNREVWLGKRRTAEQAASLEIQVYRLVQDEIPAYLTTRIRFNVAGEAREELLARVLPDGFTPVSLSGPLPARVERDGSLRVQVRAGSHEVLLLARGSGIASTLARPDIAGARWPRDEIWSFAANDSLRVAAAEGADGIDPAQANVPGDWRQLPAFRMTPESKLNIVERSRGLANADDNRLKLERNLWLDFDHGGYTAVDRISGTMRRNWRLDMQQPFTLASATLNGEQQLVTEGGEGRAGIELRRPRVDLTTVARAAAGRAMPATGWDSRFDQVAGTLHLPAGHRLIAATGTDSAPGSWWERWGLWNVFGVLIVVVFVYWTAGRIPAAIAALALVLTYQEEPAFIWLWGNLLAALAIARAAPSGLFQRIAHGYRTLSFVVLGLALLPFLWTQVRVALYPQLERVGGFAIFAPAAAQKVAEAPAAPELHSNVLLREQEFGDQATSAVSDVAAEADYVPSPQIAAPAEAASVEQPRSRRDVAIPKASSFQRYNNSVQRYAEGTVLQAGPGIPAWRYNSYRYNWSGPVEASDHVRFVYVGPVTLFFWRVLGVITLGVLFVWLAVLSFDVKWRPPGIKAAAAPGPALALPLLVLAVALCAAAPAKAQTPTPELLGELKNRLTAAPSCAPRCADIANARVVVDGDRLEVTLQVSTLASLGVAMPHASDRWQLDDISVDGRSALAMLRENDATLWVPLVPGAHTVRLAGRLAAAESISLAFPQAPRTVDVTARGWTVSGVNEGRLVAGSLELARERGAQRDGTALSAGSEFPAFVRVERVFNLDLDWTVDNYVTRIAPQRAAMSLEIPLVSGESVQTAGVKVRDGIALVGLGAGEATTEWHSGLSQGDSLEVALPEGAARTEVWSFVVNPQWNVSFDGFPPVMPENVDAPQWVFRFIPRPGERLVLKVTRPKAAGGTTLAIDSVSQQVQVGKRSSLTTLVFSYRSTQGGRHVIKLPDDARVTGVRLNRAPSQVRPEKGELPLALTPGTNLVEIDWEQSGDVGFRTYPGGVDLRSPASNIRTTIALPESRWPLFAVGPGVGPAFLYWGELVVFIGVAWLLGRWSKSPLRFAEWLLLGLGLSTQSWFVFSLTAIWLLVMRWREHRVVQAESATLLFNGVQVLLAVFTVFTIFALVFSGIRNGLLSAPDMGVMGPGSGNGSFTWFADETGGALEAPAIWSVPMWVYRALFFAWASWMAFALVRWLRWAFNAWKSGGLWRTE
jgi:hypothetical protein